MLDVTTLGVDSTNSIHDSGNFSILFGRQDLPGERLQSVALSAPNMAGRFRGGIASVIG